jgi:PLP dependent protein
MTIAENIAQVHTSIADSCARAGRSVSDVTLIAVSKTHPAEAVLEAVEAGVQHFGENRVEESAEKIPVVNAKLAVPVTWHLIGHLQSRKAKDVPPLFGVVHSVDTVKLASKLSRLMVEGGGTLDILLEMNVSGEGSKEGFDAFNWANSPAIRDRVCAEVAEVAAMPGLHIRGLMTMAPIVEQMEQARPVFASLRGLRDTLTEVLGLALPELSMGMTDDFPAAIEEGATMVRVGRAIFGERKVRM